MNVDKLIKELQINPKNPRTRSSAEKERIKQSIRELPQMLEVRPIVYADGIIQGGNGRFTAVIELIKEDGFVPKPEYFKDVTGWTKDQIRTFVIKDNLLDSDWDKAILREYWSDLPLDKWGVPTDWADEQEKQEAHNKLVDSFIVPPFTVLDTRQGYWQDRKRAWVNIGIQSELGRDETLLGFNSLTDKFGNRGGSDVNTSIFDPVLCELAYRWFCTDGGKILDPFAGGSVRGIVAGYLGYEYHGNDLSENQVNENRAQAESIDNMKKKPDWTIGDSANIKELQKGQFDFIFSCPPYYDLEVYGDKDGELSAMDWAEFIPAYKKIINESCSMLKDDRFAAFVVGDIRDKKGLYRNFVSLTIEAFIDAGLSLYNEAILVNSIGSLPLRIRKQFTSGRKMGKCHQNVLVFYKGDPKNIKNNFTEIELSDEDLQM